MTEKKSTAKAKVAAPASAKSKAAEPASAKSKTAAPASESTATKTTKQRKPKSFAFWVGTTTAVVLFALIGGIWFYGSVIFPGQQRADLDTKNITACETFRQGLAKASTEKNVDDAKQDVMVAADKGLTLFDPTFTNSDPQFGAVYDAMLRITDAGYGTGNAAVDYDNFNHEISKTIDLCKPILEASLNATSSPSPTK